MLTMYQKDSEKVLEEQTSECSQELASNTSNTSKVNENQLSYETELIETKFGSGKINRKKKKGREIIIQVQTLGNLSPISEVGE